MAVLTMVLVLQVGCNLVTVEIHQRSIMDKGDGTNDTYKSNPTESKTEKTMIKANAY